LLGMVYCGRAGCRYQRTARPSRNPNPDKAPTYAQNIQTFHAQRKKSRADEMTGTVNISRRLFDSEAFRDEPFTEREAWIWLVMEASWKDRTVRAGDYVTETTRGQLAASVRFMAKAWSWTPAKVQRYLKRVEKLEMICSKSDTGVTVVTICNYDKYQNGGKAADTGPIQDRYRTDTNEKKDERKEEGKREEDTDVSCAITPPAIDEIAKAVTAYNDAADRAGWPKVQKLSPARRQALRGRLKDAGGIEGWEHALTKAEGSNFLTGQTSKPFLASFDFITKSGNFIKIMEGNYDDKPNTNGSGRDGTSGGNGKGGHSFLDEIAAAARS
jgi:hypothetical protein